MFSNYVTSVTILIVRKKMFWKKAILDFKLKKTKFFYVYEVSGAKIVTQF